MERNQENKIVLLLRIGLNTVKHAFCVSLQCKSTGSSKLLRRVFLIRPPFAALLVSVTKDAEPGMILMHVWYGYGKFNIRFNGPKLWNELYERFKCYTSNQFKKYLTSHFISLYESLLIFWMVYIYLFIFFALFFIFTFLPSYDIYVYQCASFLTFTVLS